jgi:HlyD family secretion protein
MHPDPKRILPVLVLLGLAVTGWWYLNREETSAQSAALEASGTIEATQINISPDISGHVVEVTVKEGESVKSGQILLRLDNALLQAQLKQAEAALATAQANYNLVAVGPTAEQRQAAIATAELELLTARLALQDLTDNAETIASQALQQIAQAEKQIDSAQKRYDNLLSGATQEDIDSAHATVVLLKDQLDKAKEDFQPYENKPETNLARAAFLNKLSVAQKAYDNAVTRYNNLVGVANALDLNLTSADLALSKAQLADAQRRYTLWKDGPDPNEVARLQAQIALAEAHLVVARAEPSAEQLAIAQAQVEAAQTAIDVIKAQLDKTTLYAPVDGIVLTRSVEPGEVVAMGAPLITLGRLDDLTITVYIPEDRYGLIGLGEAAGVTVDSFPGDVFVARVTRIADQAEFTPRNVQTEEGRRTTVFAVELTVENGLSQLKPGMPADVTFAEQQ